MKSVKTVRSVIITLIILSGMFMVNFAFAIPSLQLDIKNGVYDTKTETIVSNANKFTLYAYLIPNSKNPTSDWYYISTALIKDDEGTDNNIANAGSFNFDGGAALVRLPPGNGDNTINVTSEMVYGVPPMDSYQGFDPGDLAKHDKYPTYFAEFGFQFSGSNRAKAYNTQDDAGTGPSPDPSGGMYFAAFNVDTSSLAPGYAIHFDLYNEKGKTCSNSSTDCDITSFAPFSHDAEGPYSRTPVPEPTTLILLGAGLLGLGVLKRQISKF